ncbi:MAG: hypothetical protein ACRYFK_15765 [Janthinobacterium lividum]
MPQLVILFGLLRPGRLRRAAALPTAPGRYALNPTPRAPGTPPRGLLALAAWWGWQLAAAQQLALAPAVAVARPGHVTISGVVLDDSLNVPVPGLWLYLNHTKYGAVTNAQGEFTFTFPTGWKPVRGGLLLVQVLSVPYTFKPLQVPLDWRRYNPAQPLRLRLASSPGRGRPNLTGHLLMPPPVPPPIYPPSARPGRP